MKTTAFRLAVGALLLSLSCQLVDAAVLDAARGGDELSVKAFGAVGDGATDDSAAFSAAIDQGIARGAALHVPAGVYRLSTWKEKAVPGHLVMRGDGMELVELVGPGNSTNFISAQAPVEISNLASSNWRAFVHVPALRTDLEYLDLDSVKNTRSLYLLEKPRSPGETGRVVLARVRNCWVDHSGIDERTTTGGIVLRGPYGKVSIVGNSISNVNGNAVQLGANDFPAQNLMSEAVVSGNHFENMDAPDREEAHAVLAYGREVIITGNTIRGVTTVANRDGEGIYTKARYSIVSNNTLVDASDGEAAINIKGSRRGKEKAPEGFNSICSGNQIYFTTSTGRETGIQVANGATLVEGNSIEGASVGIRTRDYLTDLEQVTIRSNKIYRTRGQVAILLEAAGGRHHVIGNEVYGVAATMRSVPNAQGILVNLDNGVGIDGLVIRGNTIEIGGECRATKELRGIDILRGEQLINVEISGNILSVSSSRRLARGLLIRGAVAGGHWRIFDNDFSGVPTNRIGVDSPPPSDLWLRDNKGADTSVMTGDGAMDVYFPITYLETSRASMLTLADGAEGQHKYVVMTKYGGVGTLKPDRLAGGTTLSFDAVGDSAHLLFTNGSWVFFGGTAVLR